MKYDICSSNINIPLNSDSVARANTDVMLWTLAFIKEATANNSIDSVLSRFTRMRKDYEVVKND